MKNIIKPEIELWYELQRNILRIVYVNNSNKKQEFWNYVWRESVFKSSEIKILKSFGYKKIGEL